jgi:hypothetical protein
MSIGVENFLHCDGPPNENKQHADCAKKKHLSARESGDDERCNGCGNETPALIAHVDSCFGIRGTLKISESAVF